MRSALLLLAGCASSLAAPVPNATQQVELAFEEFKETFNKDYSSPAEHAYKLEVFAENLLFITAHNAEAARGLHTHTVGVGPFADLTNAEFKQRWTSNHQYREASPHNVARLPLQTALAGGANGSTAVDWRAKGAVTKVKNQGQCGSCWSFSATGSAEGAWKIAGHTLTAFSEQQLVDCSKAQGNQGCQGGLMDDAFKYIIKNGGIDTEADYAYTASNGVCDKNKAGKHVGALASFKDVPSNEEEQLLAAATQQPVSVAIEADKPAFQHYKSGVLTDAGCGDKLDHGVLIVGFGTDTGKDYWIVKNSWGATWGEAGYLRIGRGLNTPKGLCGINMQPSWPVAGKPGPAPPPSPPPPAGQCDIPNAERKSCGFLVSKANCEAQNCCYDAAGLFSTHCFHPKSGPSPPSPPGPAGNPWADPSAGPCPAGSEAVKITGITGNFCSPPCSTSQACPAAPTGVTAKAQCALEVSGSSSPTRCALICPPSKAGLKGAAGECPAKATCKAIQSTGICTFDSR